MVRVSNPGKLGASAHWIQVNSTWANFRANSAIRGFATMPVRNMADAVYVEWKPTNIRNDPMRPEVGPGSESNTRARLRALGEMMPPPRAGSAGRKGPRPTSDAVTE